jgi:alkanesulfonate monooxygenase SsuD/methylene tetrahydromethanopterin reductase-like flavin-dependent oxidoreductase (luciferase family)
MPSLGLRYDFRNPPIGGTTMAERYACALEQCEWAEALGFDSVTLSEHHGVEDGYLPSALTLAAAIAARTKTMRIRIAAVLPALYHPLRLAEEAAVVDNISNGRLDLVVTNGYVPSEYEMFDEHISNRVKRTVEAVRVLRQAFTGEPFEFRGKTVRVTPTPVQKPGVPIWLGAASEGAARRAARIADMLLPSYPELWDVYRDELVKLGKPDPGPIPQGTIACLIVSETPDATWAKIAPFAMHEMNGYGKWAAESGSATGYSPVSDPDALRAMGVYQVLTPEQTVEQIRALGPYAPVLFHPLMGGTPPAQSWENLRLFETKVLPHL